MPKKHTPRFHYSRPYRNAIGAKVKALRLAARPKISQEDLCGKLAQRGVVLTRTQVAKIESRTRPVFDYELIALAKALRTTPSELCGS